MPITKRKVVILRAGVVTKDTIRNGAESIDTIDKITNLSVQATLAPSTQKAATIGLLLAPIPHIHYALTYAGDIIDKGGVIEYAPLAGNPNHALVSNITIDDLYDVLKINKH